MKTLLRKKSNVSFVINLPVKNGDQNMDEKKEISLIVAKRNLIKIIEH